MTDDCASCWCGPFDVSITCPEHGGARYANRLKADVEQARRIAVALENELAQAEAERDTYRAAGRSARRDRSRLTAALGLNEGDD